MLRLWRDEYMRCPLIEADEAGLSNITLLSDYASPPQGSPTLPYAGGLMEQPAALMDALVIYRAEYSKHEKKDG